MRKRPFGVVAIATVQIINAVSVVLRLQFRADDLPAFIATASNAEIAILIFGTVGLVAAFGLWRLSRWGWLATMLWAGLNLATSLVAYYQGTPHYVSMAMSVIAVLYLNQRDVQLAYMSQTVQERARHERP